MEMIVRIESGGQGSAERPMEPGFTGEVLISGYFRREAPSRLAGATITFGPGARTPWKMNPLGQTIVVLIGAGRVQSQGRDVIEVRAGDVIWWSPGERHWEGATPNNTMTCFVFQEEDGEVVSFMDSVNDEEYAG